MSVVRDQRHLRAHRCPICDGADEDTRGKGRRCSGFTSADGEWVHCTREDLAGSIDMNMSSNTFAHRMHGPCKCGTTHGEDLRSRTDAIEKTYDYTDEAGALLFQVVRKPGKKFLQRKPDGAGGWDWKLNGTRRTLYRLVDLVTDDADRTVYIVEGEKDADALATRGHLATTNPSGAGKWSAVAELAEGVLAERDIVIIADRDEVGRRHALEIAESLRPVARSVRVVEAQAPHKDVSDLLAAGLGLEALVPFGEPNAPTTEPTVTFPFKIWQADEIWAPLPPPDYLAEGILLRGTLAMLNAKGSSQKTWVALDLLVAVALGRPWLGRFACKPGMALFVDWESGDYELRRRIQRIAPHAAGVRFVTMAAELFFTASSFERYVTALAMEHAVIVFDSLAAGSVGLDENDVRFAGGLNMLKRISTKTGCTFVVLHHARKGGEDGDPRDSVRGTGAIFAAADVMLQIGRAKDGAMICTQTKARAGKSVEPFQVRVDDMGDITTVSAVDVANQAEADPLQKIKSRILGLLAQRHDLATRNAVCGLLTGSKGAKLEAMRQLEVDNIIAIHDGTYRLRSEIS